MNDNTKYLAIDYGEKRVGIAVSDESKKYSFVRDHLINDNSFPEKLINLIAEEKISKIIIGYPLNFKSEKTIQTLKTEEFKNRLEKLLSDKSITAEIIFFDEIFTSKLAENRIMNSGMKKKKRQEKGLVDSESAQIILQDYIDRTRNLNINS